MLKREGAIRARARKAYHIKCNKNYIKEENDKTISQAMIKCYVFGILICHFIHLLCIS